MFIFPKYITNQCNYQLQLVCYNLRQKVLRIEGRGGGGYLQLLVLSRVLSSN